MKNSRNTEHELKRQLREIVQNEPGSIRAFVANEALEYYNASSLFSDLEKGGCVSGVINSLIIYRQTHIFFDRFYEEIEILRNAWETETGQPIGIAGDLKNDLAWFAFEQVAHQMAEELDL